MSNLRTVALPRMSYSIYGICRTHTGTGIQSMMQQYHKHSYKATCGGAKSGVERHKNPKGYDAVLAQATIEQSDRWGRVSWAK